MLIGRRCGGTLVMSWPSMMSRPASGVSKPASRRSSVVLPQPELPRSANSSPRSMTRSTLSTAVIAPKRLVMPSMRTIALRLTSTARLDGGPQPRALAHLLGVAGGDGVEARAYVGRRIDQRIARDVVGHQGGRRLVGVGIAGELARRSGDLGLHHEIEEAERLRGIGCILGDRRHVDPQHRAFLRDGIGDVLPVLGLGGAVARLEDVAGITEGQADVPAGECVDVLG